MQDRPYQDQAHNAIRTEFLKGTSRQLISMATGTGKTVVFSKLPEKLGDILPGQMLILAHREELIDQAVEKMRTINPHLKIDKEKAEHRADPSTADAIVASVATLGRKGTTRLGKYNWERIDKYITDEAHHSVAQSYLNVYNAAGLLESDNKRLLLGVTATPQRGDGKALAEIYQKISYVYSMRQAIEDGWLVDVRGIRILTDTSLDAVKTVAGDFAQDMLADAVNNPHRNQLVVKAWLENGQNRQTVGFTVDIQHARDLAEMFRHYGVRAEAIWGNDPDRRKKLFAHRLGEITVLLNCGVLTEGYDDWRIGCILLARPTKSGALYVQMVGRGTRLQDGTGNLLTAIEGWTNLDLELKRDCVVIDVVDASERHSLITLPTLMGMSASVDLNGGSVVKAIQKIEDAQKLYPQVDFSKLKSLDKLSTLIEQVNLFEVKYPSEVEANSDFKWHNAVDGGFVLSLPNKEQVKIKQNLLDKYDISAIIQGQHYKGNRDTVEQAFSAADDLIRDKAADSLRILKREMPWHKDFASDKQLNYLRKIYKGKQLPDDLTKGQASALIDRFRAGKA